MTTPINSRRGLRTPLANAARRREAEVVMERGMPGGFTEDEWLGATNYGRVPNLRRAMQGPEDEPRRPNLLLRDDHNLGGAQRGKVRNMKKGGLAKAKPPSRQRAATVTKATRPAGGNRKRSVPK